MADRYEHTTTTDLPKFLAGLNPRIQRVVSHSPVPGTGDDGFMHSFFDIQHRPQAWSVILLIRDE